MKTVKCFHSEPKKRDEKILPPTMKFYQRQKAHTNSYITSPRYYERPLSSVRWVSVTFCCVFYLLFLHVPVSPFIATSSRAISTSSLAILSSLFIYLYASLHPRWPVYIHTYMYSDANPQWPGAKDFEHKEGLSRNTIYHVNACHCIVQLCRKDTFLRASRDRRTFSFPVHCS